MAFAASEMTDILVSSMDMIHMPEEYYRLVGRYPKQTDIDWIEQMGKMIKVQQTDYYHHEEGRIIQAPVIADKANSGSADVIITLASESHYLSGTRSYPRVKNLVQFSNGATGLVIAKSTTTPSAHTITVRPVNSDQDVRTAAVVGATFICYSYAFEEGASGPDESVIPDVTKFSNQLMIFKDKFTVTSSEETNKTWFEVPTPDGGWGRAYYLKGEADTADRFRLAEQFGLFITPKSDNLVDADSNTIRTSRALIPTMEQYANIMEYSTEVTMDLYNTLSKTINKNYGDSEYVLGMGLNFSQKNTAFLSAFGKNGAVVYNSFGGGDMGSKKALSLGFNSIEMDGYTYHTKKLNVLSHADTTGAAGFPYPDYCLAIPMGKGADPRSGEMIDYFGIRYKEWNNGPAGKGTYRRWETGGNAPVPTDASLKRSLNLASEKGLQVFGSKRYVLIKKA